MVALHAISTILYTNSTSMYHYSLVSLGFYLLFLTKGRKVQDNQFGRISKGACLRHRITNHKTRYQTRASKKRSMEQRLHLAINYKNLGVLTDRTVNART
jgi:hypothetical protein